MLLHLLLLLLLLCEQGLCQCFSEVNCIGDIVDAANQRDCCVLRDGLSHNDAGTCRTCIGRI